MTRLTRHVCILILLGFPHALNAGLQGSSHDFSNKVWSGGEICLPCHNAHHAISTRDGAPLWNRSAGTATYRVYSNPASHAESGPPGGVSRLCLSCHDGITPLDSYGGNVGSTTMVGAGVIGLAPGDHHPVSFVFDQALAAATGDLRDPVTAPSGLGDTIDRDLLRNGKVECTSCHDVHNATNNLRYIEVGGGPDALCDICHIHGH